MTTSQVELPFVAGIADRPAMPDGAPIGVGVGGDTGRTDHGIPNSCVTIIQISNGIDWDGINHTSFVHLAISAPAKAAHCEGAPVQIEGQPPPHPSIHPSIHSSIHPFTHSPIRSSPHRAHTTPPPTNRAYTHARPHTMNCK